MPPCDATNPLSVGALSLVLTRKNDDDAVLIQPSSSNVSETTQKLRSENSQTSTSTQQKLNRKNQEYDPFLKGLYLMVVHLCVSMTWWIMISPASWLIERSSFHRNVLLPLLEKYGAFRVVPISIVEKYQGHSMIHFSHFVPGAIWAAIIPFQLHPTWRNNHKTLHRWMGYLFLVASQLISVGVVIILQRQLTYNHFFPDLPKKLGHEFQAPFQLAMAAWFSGTAILAVQMARWKRIHDHQIWMIRHVAAGIWIALQRMVVVPICMALLYVIRPPPLEIPSYWQREIFAASAMAAWGACIALAEIAVHRMRMPRLSSLKKEL